MLGSLSRTAKRLKDAVCGVSVFRKKSLPKRVNPLKMTRLIEEAHDV
jgi:hypothetical protein